MPPQLLARRALYIAGYDNHIQNGAHDCLGPATTQGSYVKPAMSGQSDLEETE
jgi:hypothetical protein